MFLTISHHWQMISFVNLISSTPAVVKWPRCVVQVSSELCSSPAVVKWPRCVVHFW